MKPINLCKIEYQKEFEHDEFLNMAIGRVEMLGRCVGIFFLKFDKIISSKFKRYPLMVHQGQEVQEAFMSSYGVDLRSFSGGRIAELVSEIEVVRV